MEGDTVKFRCTPTRNTSLAQEHKLGQACWTSSSSQCLYLVCTVALIVRLRRSEGQTTRQRFPPAVATASELVKIEIEEGPRYVVRCLQCLPQQHLADSFPIRTVPSATLRPNAYKERRKHATSLDSCCSLKRISQVRLIRTRRRFNLDQTPLHNFSFIIDTTNQLDYNNSRNHSRRQDPLSSTRTTITQSTNACNALQFGCQPFGDGRARLDIGPRLGEDPQLEISRWIPAGHSA